MAGTWITGAPWAPTGCSFGPWSIHIYLQGSSYAGLDCKSQMVAAICRRQRLNSGEAKWLEMKTWELEGHLIKKAKFVKLTQSRRARRRRHTNSTI